MKSQTWFFYTFFEENYNSPQAVTDERTNKIGDWVVKMRNKSICLELKMDRVFYFAARRETDGGWQQMDRRALSSICSSSPSRLLHCWCLRFHCWVLLQGSATTQGSKPWGNTGLDENRLNGKNHINISYTTKGNSHMRSCPFPMNVSTWKLWLSFSWCFFCEEWQISLGNTY